MNFKETLELEKRVKDFFEDCKCTLCDLEMPGIEDAIEEGWTPAFYVADKCYEIACPACSEMYLQLDEDAEFELKPGFVKTFMTSSSSKEK